MPWVIHWAAVAIANALIPSGIAVSTVAVAGTGAVAISTMTATTYGVTATAIAAAAIEAAAYVAIGALTAPKVAAAQGRPTEWTADPDASIPFIMGRREGPSLTLRWRMWRASLRKPRRPEAWGGP